MTLKESFRYQKFLSRIFDSALPELIASSHAQESIKKKHDAYPGHQDEIIPISKYGYPYEADTLLDFLGFLIAEKEKLSEAIYRAKSQAAGCVDSAMEVNSMRRRLFNAIRSSLRLKESRIRDYDKSTGYYLGSDGEQKSYQYETITHTYTTFDRKSFRSTAETLIRRAEKTSQFIENRLAVIEVEYDPPLDVHNTVEDAYEEFAARL